ncbi:hypothetical protein RFN29_15115 [Mesorhizobium sp. VK22B]|uniref:Uncharacterized protein n=1 Tax=Mesorhizobium captivum TaxID=3072319 RepID=A0ABU4Z4H4_9HYPH|nr:hypothetical protein [Mesorhizobium sp. VK22B]MDX8492907.1 hypothetical protein [Mesorhizobium sp. VK22B]
MTQSPDEIEATLTDAINAMSAEHYHLSYERHASSIRIAVAQNVATNGRLFCALLAFANFSIGWHWGVAYAAVPVGFAWIADLTDRPWLKRGCAHSSVLTAAMLAVATLLKCW